MSDLGGAVGVNLRRDCDEGQAFDAVAVQDHVLMLIVDIDHPIGDLVLELELPLQGKDVAI